MYLKTSDLEKMELGFGGHFCHWGTHIAGLYETIEERDRIVEGFLLKGLEEGDVQRYCLDKKSDENIKRRISEKNPLLSGEVNNPDRMMSFDPEKLYYPEGFFSPDQMEKGLDSVYRSARFISTGRIRAFSEMSWALEKIPGVEELMIYESRLNNFIQDKPWVSLCLYDITRFSGEIIMEVFRTHPYVINKNVITENPFYMRHDVWLKEHNPGRELRFA